MNKKGEATVNEAIVDFMKAHEKYVYGLLSSTDLSIEETLDFYQIGSYFSLIYTTGDLGMSKDSKKFYLRAAKEINIPANEIIMVDDDKDFIQAAGSAGLKTLLYSPHIDLSKSVAALDN